MTERSHALQLIYRPRDGPRRRVSFERDRTVGDWEYAYWRIEEVYEATDGVWREIGREHVTEPDLVLEVDDAVTADTEGSIDA